MASYDLCFPGSDYPTESEQILPDYEDLCTSQVFVVFMVSWLVGTC